MLYIIYICVYIHIYLFIYLFIYLGFSFTIVLYVCYLLWNYFMCILLYMIMCMLLSATSTHSKWELMLYCLHCPTLNKVFLLLLLLLLFLPWQPLSDHWKKTEWNLHRSGQNHLVDCLVIHLCVLDSLWPNDAIWCHWSWSALVQVMAWCLTAPSHYPNQWNLIFIGLL